MAIIKMAHSIVAILFLTVSVLLSLIYFIYKNKGNPLIGVLVKSEWFFSALMFFLGMILMVLNPFWFQVGLFHIKIAFAMFGIGAAQYFYKQYEIANSENNFPTFLYYFRVLIPSFIFTAYYLGNKLLMA
ncbi:MAG: hypothetical protein H8E60_08610 [Candidatus Marinimicrobia bacterium]|nr:hypothetical protein [Candidatus Neomarinimicrobiota bacterium]